MLVCDDISKLLEVFLKLRTVDFECVKKEVGENSLYVRDENSVAKFVFDGNHNITGFKIIPIEINRKEEVKEDKTKV